MPTPVRLEMLNIWLWLTRDFLIVESTVTVQVKFYSRFKLFFGEITYVYCPRNYEPVYVTVCVCFRKNFT